MFDIIRVLFYIIKFIDFLKDQNSLKRRTKILCRFFKAMIYLKYRILSGNIQYRILNPQIGDERFNILKHFKTTIKQYSFPQHFIKIILHIFIHIEKKNKK